jgi:hypothetical protein
MVAPTFLGRVPERTYNGSCNREDGDRFRFGVKIALHMVKQRKEQQNGKSNPILYSPKFQEARAVGAG